MTIPSPSPPSSPFPPFLHPHLYSWSLPSIFSFLSSNDFCSLHSTTNHATWILSLQDNRSYDGMTFRFTQFDKPNLAHFISLPMGFLSVMKKIKFVLFHGRSVLIDKVVKEIISQLVETQKYLITKMNPKSSFLSRSLQLRSFEIEFLTCVSPNPSDSMEKCLDHILELWREMHIVDDSISLSLFTVTIRICWNYFCLFSLDKISQWESKSKLNGISLRFAVTMAPEYQNPQSEWGCPLEISAHHISTFRLVDNQMHPGLSFTNLTHLVIKIEKSSTSDSKSVTALSSLPPSFCPSITSLHVYIINIEDGIPVDNDLISLFTWIHSLRSTLQIIQLTLNNTQMILPTIIPIISIPLVDHIYPHIQQFNMEIGEKSLICPLNANANDVSSDYHSDKIASIETFLLKFPHISHISLSEKKYLWLFAGPLSPLSHVKTLQFTNSLWPEDANGFSIELPMHSLSDEETQSMGHNSIFMQRVQSLISYCPHVRIIDWAEWRSGALQIFPNDYPKICGALTTNCPHVTTVNVIKTEIQNHDFLPILLSTLFHFPLLTTLNLSYRHTWSDNVMKCLSDCVNSVQNPRITKLIVSDVKNAMAIEWTAKILERLPRLTHLDIVVCGHHYFDYEGEEKEMSAVSNVVKSIGMMRNLKYLKFGCHPKILQEKKMGIIPSLCEKNLVLRTLYFDFVIRDWDKDIDRISNISSFVHTFLPLLTSWISSFHFPFPYLCDLDVCPSHSDLKDLHDLKYSMKCERRKGEETGGPLESKHHDDHTEDVDDVDNDNNNTVGNPSSNPKSDIEMTKCPHHELLLSTIQLIEENKHKLRRNNLGNFAKILSKHLEICSSSS